MRAKLGWLRNSFGLEMKLILLISAAMMVSLLRVNIAEADEAFLSQAEALFSSEPAPSSSSAIAVPVAISASGVILPETNLFKQNFSQVSQKGTDNSSIGSQIGGGNLSIVSQQGSGNKIVISQRNAR